MKLPTYYKWILAALFAVVVVSARSQSLTLKTNTLYDAVLVPNVGVEVNLGKQWTTSADWIFPWLFDRHKHRYWQSYGGYLTVRKYLKAHQDVDDSVNGKRTFPKGHHVGAYFTAITYDIEFGGKGYQADDFGFGGGIEYGYSKYIGRHLDIDFTIGLGFQDGEYKEYEPSRDQYNHYVWKATHRRHWWGPTKAEVSIKWLLERKKEGGKR